MSRQSLGSRLALVALPLVAWACWDPELDGDTLTFYVQDEPYHCHALPFVWGKVASERVALGKTSP